MSYNSNLLTAEKCKQPKPHRSQSDYFFKKMGKKGNTINTIVGSYRKPNKFNMQPKTNQSVYPVVPNTSRKRKSSSISICNEGC